MGVPGQRNHLQRCRQTLRRLHRFSAESSTKRNVLNHYDHGPLIQQFYYGNPDGSNWNGKPWRYNPVQRGRWRGEDARILAFRIDADNGLYAKVEPVHWASRCCLSDILRPVTNKGRGGRGLAYC